MKNIKRVSLVAMILVVALIAGGCVNKTITISWEPNPIVIKPGDENIEGVATITVSAGISSVTINNVSAIGYDEAGEPVDGMTFSKDVDVTVPIIVGGSASQKVVFPIPYEKARDSGVRKVTVSVTGSISGKLDIEVIVEEESNDPV